MSGQNSRAEAEARARAGRDPAHRVELERSPATVSARWQGRVVAESKRSWLVRETGCAPVVYFPREDLRWELFQASDRYSFCPYKGAASYWSLREGDQAEENAAWSYESPFDEVADLRGCIAFYPERVEVSSPA